MIVPATKATEVAIWLRDDHAFRLDYCSNVTGIDYLDREFKEKVKNEEGKTETIIHKDPARMEVAYHLYSMEKRTGPLVMKQRTTREKPEAQSLTPSGEVANCRSGRFTICLASISPGTRINDAS